jgi:hypothetical protein
MCNPLRDALRRKLIYLVSFVLVLFLSGAAQGVLQPNDGSISGNLSLWLRAPGTYFDPGTGVWTDVSPKGNDAEPVGYVDAWRITYVAPTLSSGSNSLVFDNDFSTVKFGANTDDLIRATNLNGGVGLGELTILVVYKVTPPSPASVRAVGFGSISGEGENMGNNFNLSVDVSIRKDNGMVGGATVAHPDDKFLIRVARMNGIDIDQWFNSDGTLVQVHAAPGTAFITCVDNFYLGDLRAGVTPTIDGSLAMSDIEIAEVVVYNTALSEAQIEGVSEWLQANVGVVLGSRVQPHIPLLLLDNPCIDSDGDGFYAAQKGCWPVDCYDRNADARPGQTSYFQSHRGDGSYDYNCDGIEEKDQTWYDYSRGLCDIDTISCYNTHEIRETPACGQYYSHGSMCMFHGICEIVSWDPLECSCDTISAGDGHTRCR